MHALGRIAVVTVFLSVAGLLGLAWLADRSVTGQLDAAVHASNGVAPKADRER